MKYTPDDLILPHLGWGSRSHPNNCNAPTSPKKGHHDSASVFVGIQLLFFFCQTRYVPSFKHFAPNARSSSDARRDDVPAELQGRSAASSGGTVVGTVVELSEQSERVMAPRWQKGRKQSRKEGVLFDGRSGASMRELFGGSDFQKDWMSVFCIG